MVFNATFNNISAISWWWQGFQYFAIVPVLHYLQAVHFIKNLKAFHKYLIGRDRMIVGEVYSMQHYVIKFVSDLRQVGGFLRALRFRSSNITDQAVQ
jgi:hypothetical protein